MKKYTLGALVVLVAILALGGWLWYGKHKEKQAQVKQEVPQTAINTSSWKTYQNTDYGFSVKYPGEWKEMPLANDIKGMGFTEGNGHIFTVAYYGGFNDGGWVDSSGNHISSLEEYVKSTNLDSVKEIDFHGLKAFTGIEKNKIINYVGRVIFVENKGYLYELSFPKTTELNDVQNEIVSSFKFI